MEVMLSAEYDPTVPEYYDGRSYCGRGQLQGKTQFLKGILVANLVDAFHHWGGMC
jgi:hypothetical protein